MKNTFPLALTFLTKIPGPGTGRPNPRTWPAPCSGIPWVGAILGLVFLGAWRG